jgi:IS605 OrfB family transposase
LKTLKLHIKSIENPNLIGRKQRNYSFAYRNLFKQLEMCGDSEFVNGFKNRFELTDIEFRSLKSEVETRFKMEKTRLDKVQSDIDDINEKLNIKNGVNDTFTREANRKNKNLWSRDLLVQSITRRCNETGIQLVEVNPCFTSFIGNIQHQYGDSCSASVEIARRGAFKYNKGTFYPHITEEDTGTLESIFGSDALCSTARNWIDLCKSLRERFGNEAFQHRVRAMNVKCPCRSSSLVSYKSRIITINYNTL